MESGQPITWGKNQQNWATLGGGFSDARLTKGNPDHVDRTLNERPKNLRKKIY